MLKGQELINSAKVKNLATDFKNIPVFIYGYQDKFKALPGDDKDYNLHLASAVAGTGGTLGNGVIEGIWNASGAVETHTFWQHVRLAGLAAGPTTDPTTTDIHPTNAVGGTIGITNAAQSPIATLKGSYIVCSDGIAGKFAKQLDITLDDGNPTTGSLQVITVGATAVGGTATPAPLNDDTTYLVCMGF